MRTFTIVNLTPHAIVVRGEGGDTVLPPSGAVARVNARPSPETEEIGAYCPDFVGHVLVAAADLGGEITGLPHPAEGTLLLVSAVVGAEGGVRGEGRKDAHSRLKEVKPTYSRVQGGSMNVLTMTYQERRALLDSLPERTDNEIRDLHEEAARERISAGRDGAPGAVQITEEALTRLRAENRRRGNTAW